MEMIDDDDDEYTQNKSFSFFLVSLLNKNLIISFVSESYVF